MNCKIGEAKSNYKRLGDFIEPCDEKNSQGEQLELRGISNQKYFQKAKTNTNGVDLTTYRVVRTGQFAFNRATTRNGDKISIALSQEVDCIVSPSYRIFRSKDENVLNSEYLMMWFKRPEFDRYARFKSHGSAHEFFDYAEMCEVELPIPPIEKQREIVREYNTIVKRISLNEQLNKKLEETAQAIYKRWFVDFEFPDENGKPYKSSSGKMVWSEEFEKEIPAGWEIDTLKNKTILIKRGITPKYTDGIGCIVINQKCIRNNTIDFHFARKHDMSLKPVPKEKILRDFDILINSTGEGTLGRVGLTKDLAEITTVDTHVTIVRSNNEINPIYLWSIISNNSGSIEALGAGSTGQTELSRDELGALPILVPPDKYQLPFSLMIRAIIDQTVLLEREMPILIELKDLILAKLTKVEETAEKEMKINL